MNLTKLSKWLGVLIIFTAPIDFYLLNIPFIINLSFYRLFLIILIIIFFIQKVINPKLKGGREFYIVVILYIAGMAIGILQSKRPGEFSSYFLNEIMGLFMIVIFSNIYERDDLKLLLNTFILSFIFPFVISLYVYYVFYNELRLVDILPLSDILPFLKTIELDTRPFRFGFFPRLGLPYFTSPHLAIVTSILLFIVAILYKSKSKIFLLLPIILILIGTLTRTVILSVLLTIIIYFFIFLNNNYIKLTRVKKIYLIYTVFLVIITVIVINSSAYEALVRRASQRTNITEERHFILLIEAFNIIFSSFKNFLVGIGDGNLKFMVGQYTFLPPDSILNSYLTVFVHRGILGLLFNYMLYFYLFFYLFQKKSQKDKVSYALLFSFINVLVAFNLYELRLVTGVWILMALIAVYVNNQPKLHEEDLINNSSI